jgi:hypothetical protein
MGYTHKYAIDSLVLGKHVNVGSAWIGAHAHARTHTHTSAGEKSAENAPFFLWGFQGL